MKRLIIEGIPCYEIFHGEPDPIDAGRQLYYRDGCGDVRRYPTMELITDVTAAAGVAKET